MNLRSFAVVPFAAPVASPARDNVAVTRRTFYRTADEVIQ